MARVIVVGGASMLVIAGLVIVWDVAVLAWTSFQDFSVLNTGAIPPGANESRLIPASPLGLILLFYVLSVEHNPIAAFALCLLIGVALVTLGIVVFRRKR
jgi:hypothetical protein